MPAFAPITAAVCDELEAYLDEADAIILTAMPVGGEGNLPPISRSSPPLPGSPGFCCIYLPERSSQTAHRQGGTIPFLRRSGPRAVRLFHPEMLSMQRLKSWFIPVKWRKYY
ncbi:hypothetical protein [Methanogenium cariaci]|uniref:hypothetical protein n=1 Tax=Methanogenium cariaci TaxID=2197 RepID=UPI0007850A3F|nr:hypothetical protein [Methanogenium cariaci]